MSAIASFIKLPKSALAGLRIAAASGAEYEYLSAKGREVVEYGWSGYVLGNVLDYLDEKHQIDLTKSEYNELAQFLTNSTGASHIILTSNQRAAFGDRLDPELFSED